MPVTYSIAAVANLTGLSADTLRAWERRYAVVAPERDAFGIRRYTQADVARLDLARSAVDLGHSIRDIATLTNARLRALLREARDKRAAPDPSAESTLATVLAAVQRYDVERTESILTSAALLLPAETLVLEVLAPLLRSIGTMWQSSECSIAQEHLTSNIVRNLLALLTRVHRQEGGPTMLLATPSGELHEFGIALAACLAAVRGTRATMLGPSAPAAEVVRSARKLLPDVVVVGGVFCHDAAALDSFLREIERDVPERTRLWAGGEILSALGKKHHGRWESVPTLEDFADRMMRGGGPGALPRDRPPRRPFRRPGSTRTSS